METAPSINMGRKYLQSPLLSLKKNLIITAMIINRKESSIAITVNLDRGIFHRS
jgi:hypothetical protein